jgi:hypothetical protein
MVLFSSMGYAQFTTTLSVDGTLIEPETVYITNISISGTSTSTTPTVTQKGTLIFEHGNYSLNKQQWGGSSGAITISVTVKNNSGRAQYFSYHTTLDAADLKKLNENTKTTYVQSGEERLVGHGETKTFTFTIQNTTRSSVSMKNFESVLVFSPEFNVQDTEDATRSLAKVFASVLAGKGPNGDGVGIIYKGREIPANKIMDEITAKMTDVETGGYTGNVGNETQDEKDLIEAIFGENVIIQIGSNYYSVSMLIKNHQIDNRGANDMVIYVTADQLNIGAGVWRNNSWQNLNIVPVYGLVFIKDGNGYKYCDHLFAGEAPVCDFGGALGEGKVGNFHTNIWNSTEFDVSDTSGGSIGQQYITTNGELDEAYQYFIQRNPGALIDPDKLQ